jgi:hypothetical protein
MNAIFRIFIWFFSALLSALPIYILVAPTAADWPLLFELDQYGVAAKAIFLLYFSMTVVAFFNLLECSITAHHHWFWRLLLGLCLLLIFLQAVISAVYYRDIYLDKALVSSSFAKTILLWTITQSFFARLFFLAGREAQ